MKWDYFVVFDLIGREFQHLLGRKRGNVRREMISSTMKEDLCD